jgi:tRNA nucleotidyltransferase (CCA-adding enzyme)
MARLSLPGPQLNDRARSVDVPRPEPPFRVEPEALDVLHQLWRSGHAGYLVGGGVRDALLGRSTNNWDLATDATPDQLMAIFPAGVYQNRFGTVLVRAQPTPVEVTTFRVDHRYADHRRPDQVTFTDDPVADLARRDFTVNAIAWGRTPLDRAPESSADGGPGTPEFLDPTGGRADLDRRLLRAVGDPDARFDEDALRMLRAARLAAQVGLTLDPPTFEAMRRHAADVAWVSGERVGAELRRLMTSPQPSVGLRVLADSELLAHLVPELAAQRGIPQAKIAGKDLWDHTLLTVDAAASRHPTDERMALAALLHDAGKPETFADGHFRGHAAAGAIIARRWLSTIAYPARDAEHVARLIEEHMFEYAPRWSDAAVRRFIRRVGLDQVDDLLALRELDNIGSGLDPQAGHLDELRRRIVQERDAPLALGDLAIDGNDLLAELGGPPGPWLGRVLDRLLDSVVRDPRRNNRERLLTDARLWAPKERES